MRTLLQGFWVATVSLTGTTAVLALTRLVLVQVHALTRLTRQLSNPTNQASLPWEFADCGQPPGWLLPPPCRTGHPEP
jgi:hypothetical protein